MWASYALRLTFKPLKSVILLLLLFEYLLCVHVTQEGAKSGSRLGHQNGSGRHCIGGWRPSWPRICSRFLSTGQFFPAVVAPCSLRWPSCFFLSFHWFAQALRDASGCYSAVHKKKTLNWLELSSGGTGLSPPEETEKVSVVDLPTVRCVFHRSQEQWLADRQSLEVCLKADFVLLGRAKNTCKSMQTSTALTPHQSITQIHSGHLPYLHISKMNRG